MQCANSTSGRQAKKHKYTVDEAPMIGDLKKASNSDEPANDEPASHDPTPSSDRTSEASNILKPHEADVTTFATPIQMQSSGVMTSIVRRRDTSYDPC